MKKLLIVLASALFAASAHAAPILKFDDPGGAGGTVSYAGGNAPLVGTGILFDNILGDGTPANFGVAGSLTCVGCELNFTTGNLISAGTATDPFIFAGGGSLSITGAAYQGITLIANGVLVDGAFTGNALAQALPDASGLAIASGQDFKDPSLLDYFGIGDVPFGFVTSQLSLGGCTAPGDDPTNGFTCSIDNADFNNAESVPAPGVTALMGIGLLLLARRKLTAGGRCTTCGGSRDQCGCGDY